MITISIIGNLAADAQIVSGNGKEWVSFRMADTRRWIDQKGVNHESTQWASCIMQAPKGSLLQYLKKGQKVYVQGTSEIEIYSSPKLKRMVARYNISVQHVELCGGSADPVPRQLAAPDGTLLPIYKAFYIDPSEQEKNHYGELFDTTGGVYAVDKVGFVSPVQLSADASAEPSETDKLASTNKTQS